MSDAVRAFEERFGSPPTHVARAPGRVNLMGDHTDYNGLPVLPMALQREVRLAFRPRGDGLVVLHAASGGLDPLEFEIRPGLDRYPEGHWGNYVKAPANELARRFAIWRGLEGVLTSDVPMAAGLSSSSAVVTTVGLALAQINEVQADERSFAELMADAERYTGTRGGAMDHVVSLGARAGCAVRISFQPLRLQHIPLPEGWCFVVADSGVRAEKSGPARKAYNLRRSECEEAFARVVDEVVRRGAARTTPSGFADLVRLLGVPPTLELAETVLEPTLFRRLRHVLSEAARVDEAADLMRGADYAGFGTLMDASHGSLRTDFLVSTAELDELAAIALEGGAAGARLTGAGFGGCIVALADRSTVGSVLETLTAEYYEPRSLTDGIGDRLFVAVPSAGAGVTEVAG